VIGSNKYVETLQQETSQLVNGTVVWQPTTTCGITDINMNLHQTHYSAIVLFVCIGNCTHATAIVASGAGLLCEINSLCCDNHSGFLTSARSIHNIHIPHPLPTLSAYIITVNIAENMASEINNAFEIFCSNKLNIW